MSVLRITDPTAVSDVIEGFESCLVLGPNAHGSLDGAKLYPFSIIAAGPGAQAELIIDKDSENVGWVVPLKVLDRHLDLRGRTRDFSISTKADVWHPAEEEARGTVLGPQTGLFVYNVGATALFVLLGTIGAMNGLLLWPAAALHLVISLLMLGAIIRHCQE